MRNLLLVFGALLVMAGIVSTNLWRNLRTERQANAELRTQFAGAKACPAALPPVQSSALPAPAGEPAKPATAACAPQTADFMTSQAASAAISAGVVASVTGSGEQDLLKDPEYRKAQLTVARLKLAQSNPGLAETLGLSESEAGRLFEVMAEHQLKLTAEFAAASAAAGGGVPALADAVRRASSIEDPIRATLGEAKYAQYQDYQRNVRPALTQLASLGSTLTSVGQPLSDSQSRALTTALLAEQQRQRQEAALPRANPNPGAPRGLVESLEEGNNRQDEGNRRILEAAAPSLNPAQLATLREQFEKQAASRRRTLDSARDMESRRQ